MKQILFTLLLVFLFLGYAPVVNAQSTCKFAEKQGVCVEAGERYSECVNDPQCPRGLCLGKKTICCAVSNHQCLTAAISPEPGPSPTAKGPSVGLVNPLQRLCPEDMSPDVCIQRVIGNVIRAALGIVGSIALAIFIYGGFLWLTSGGNPEKIKKGKDAMIWATIGLAVIFASYAIVSFIIQKITEVPKQ